MEVSRTTVYYLPVTKDEDDLAIMHPIDEIYTRWLLHADGCEAYEDFKEQKIRVSKP